MSVYRELFVEVPLALLEAAVTEAQTREAPPAPPPSPHIDLASAARQVALALGCTHVEAWREAMSDQVRLVFRGPCTHRFVVWIDEHLLLVASTTADLVDYIRDDVTRTPCPTCGGTL